MNLHIERVTVCFPDINLTLLPDINKIHSELAAKSIDLRIPVAYTLCKSMVGKKKESNIDIHLLCPSFGPSV